MERVQWFCVRTGCGTGIRFVRGLGFLVVFLLATFFGWSNRARATLIDTRPAPQTPEPLPDPTPDPPPTVPIPDPLPGDERPLHLRLTRHEVA